MKTKLLTLFMFLIVTSTQVLAARPSINALNTRVNQLEAENNAQQVEIGNLDIRVTGLEAAGVSPAPFSVVGTIDMDGKYVLDLLEVSFLVNIVRPGGGIPGGAKIVELSVLVDPNGGAEAANLLQDFLTGVAFTTITIGPNKLGLGPTLELVNVIIEAYESNPNKSFNYATQIRLAFSPKKISVIAPNGNLAEWDITTGALNSSCNNLLLSYNNANQVGPGSFEYVNISGDANLAGAGAGTSGFILNEVELMGVQTVNEAPCYFGTVVANMVQGNGTIDVFDSAGSQVQSISMTDMFFTSYRLSLTVGGYKQDVTIDYSSIEFVEPTLPPK